MGAMRRGYIALASGISFLLLMGFGTAMWAIIASVRQAAQRGFTPYYGLDQATHDAILPVLAWTLLALPLIWIVGTIALLAVAEGDEASFRLLLVIFGQFLCLLVWILPLALPYGVGMGAWVMWSARRHAFNGLIYRATIGAVLTLSGVLYATELIAGSVLWSVLACYAVFLVAYCALVLIRPAILHLQ